MDIKRLSELLIAAAIGAIIPIVGAVYLLGGRMADMDRLTKEVEELRSEARSTKSSVEGIRADVKKPLSQALQNYGSQPPPLQSRSENHLVDQVTTATEVEEVIKFSEQRKIWAEDLTDHITNMIDGLIMDPQKDQTDSIYQDSVAE